MNRVTYKSLVQGSEEWLEARRGMLTASNVGKHITPSTLKVADNETSRTLTMQLAAERITGHVEYTHPTLDMQRGTDDEPFARAVYADTYGPVEEIGFVTLEQDGPLEVQPTSIMRGTFSGGQFVPTSDWGTL